MSSHLKQPSFKKKKIVKGKKQKNPSYLIIQKLFMIKRHTIGWHMCLNMQTFLSNKKKYVDIQTQREYKPFSSLSILWNQQDHGLRQVCFYHSQFENKKG